MTDIFKRNEEAVNAWARDFLGRIQQGIVSPQEDAPMEYVTLQVYFVGRAEAIEYNRVWKSDVDELVNWLRGGDEWYVVNTDNAVIHLAMKRIEAVSVIDEEAE